MTIVILVCYCMITWTYCFPNFPSHLVLKIKMNLNRALLNFPNVMNRSNSVSETIHFVIVCTIFIAAPIPNTVCRKNANFYYCKSSVCAVIDPSAV